MVEYSYHKVREEYERKEVKGDRIFHNGTIQIFRYERNIIIP